MQDKLVLHLSGSTYTIYDSELMNTVSFTQNVNSDTDFNPGQVASAQIKFVTLYHPIPKGTQIDWSTRLDSNENWKARGIFFVTDVTKSGDVYTVTAFDSVIKLDKEINAFLETTDATTVYTLYYRLCQYCGLTPYNTGFACNATMGVDPLTLMNPGLTGRTLMSYICKAVGGYCVARPNGYIHVDVFSTPSPSITINESDIESIDISDEDCPRVTGVRVQTAEGACYSPGPNASEQISLFYNPLFYPQKIEDIQHNVDALYTEVHKILPYRSASIHLFEDKGINAGDIITVSLNSVNYRVMIFQKTINDNGCELSCSGGPQREAVILTMYDKIEQQQGDKAVLTGDTLNYNYNYISFNESEVFMPDVNLPGLYTDDMPYNTSLVALLNQIISELHLREQVQTITRVMTPVAGRLNIISTGLDNAQYEGSVPVGAPISCGLDASNNIIVQCNQAGDSTATISVRTSQTPFRIYNILGFDNAFVPNTTYSLAFPFGTDYDNIRLEVIYDPSDPTFSTYPTVVADYTNRDCDNQYLKWELSEQDSCIYLKIYEDGYYRFNVYDSDSAHMGTVAVWRFYASRYGGFQ